MIKKNKATLITTSVVTLLPIIVGIVLWDKLPDKVAVHFNVNNEADNWAGKGMAVCGIPIFLLVMHWVCVIATQLDKRKSHIDNKMMTSLLWICPALSVTGSTIMYMYALNIQVKIGMVCIILMGIIFMVLGNFLPKCKRNSVVGVRTSWTLGSDDNWRATNRMAGWCYVVAGAVSILTAIFENIIIFFSVVVLAAVIPIIYSYWYSKKHGVSEKENKYE